MIYQGGCLCGAVRYRIEGEVMGSMICHCRTCRRASGTPVVAALSVERDALSIAGETVAFQSSPKVTRRFCGVCGTGLFYEHGDEPEEVAVNTCTLDEPEAFPPTHHSWLSHDLSWIRFSDDLPSFAESRYGNSGV
jgi:hypothetical protein